MSNIHQQYKEETVPLNDNEDYEYSEDDDDDDEGDEYFLKVGDDDDDPNSFQAIREREARKEMRQADRLSVRLLAIADDDDEAEEQILVESLGLGEEVSPPGTPESLKQRRGGKSMKKSVGLSMRATGRFRNMLDFYEEELQKKAGQRVCCMISVACAFLVVVVGLIYTGIRFVGPPSQPVGPYTLIERQEGEDFFQYYTFYEGRDSAGSNGYIMYVGRPAAEAAGICNVTWEDDELDVYNAKLEDSEKEAIGEKKNKQESETTQQRRRNRRKLQQAPPVNATLIDDETAWRNGARNSSSSRSNTSEPFVYLGSAPTKAGPRDSIRLEGNRRFNRGLFIIDVRHMPAGCGTWPAFWLTDEANWPVNGEIDIVEGVNYQHMAKTAMHSTKGCEMDDIPLGTMTGTWDTAQGIPDKKTGVPDMTLRYAQNCFVYDPHQWLNQGCVAVDKLGGTLGGPLNQKGGGVYALEWDPVNHHVRSWVFTPHSNVPDNLVQAIHTAHFANPDDRIMPDPSLWPTPYGFFAIGQGTNCPSFHFKQMRLVLNTAFCGSVAGNRFNLDCPKHAKQFKTCNDWVKSDPEELKEAYWKIRGVYVYEREWERTWLN